MKSFAVPIVVIQRLSDSPTHSGGRGAPRAFALGVAAGTHRAAFPVDWSATAAGHDVITQRGSHPRLDPLCSGGRHGKEGKSIVRHEFRFDSVIPDSRTIVDASITAASPQTSRRTPTVFDYRIGDGDEKSPP